MSISDLAIIVGFLAALSAASERIVDFFKTLFNKWLGTPPKEEPAPGEGYPPGEVARRICLQIIAFGAAWFSAAWFASKLTTELTGGSKLVMEFDMIGDIHIAGLNIPVVVVGMLGSAGSKFWQDVLEYTNLMKKTSKENLNIVYLQRAEAEKAIGVQAHAVERR